MATSDDRAPQNRCGGGVVRLLRTVSLALCLAVACSSTAKQDANAGPGTGATLKDFSIALEAVSAPAGSTTFDIANDGPSTHEFEVIRTDLAVDALPVSSAQVNVDSLNLIDEVEGTAPGTLTHLTVDLTPGNYVLICNVAGHYQAGMRIAFTAT
jgi:uncharacterized cupredoxin-like copper-binding protein